MIGCFQRNWGEQGAERLVPVRSGAVGASPNVLVLVVLGHQDAGPSQLQVVRGHFSQDLHVHGKVHFQATFFNVVVSGGKNTYTLTNKTDKLVSRKGLEKITLPTLSR